jgi:hypothetical protein
MSLNWNLGDVKNYKRLYRKLKEGERGYSQEEVNHTLKQKYEQIIWHTMIIGMREITDDNWEQFYNRINIWEKTVGTNLYKGRTKKLIPLYVQKEDVQRMIGLRTNASTMTANQFKKHLFFNLERWGMKI